MLLYGVWDGKYLIILQSCQLALHHNYHLITNNNKQSTTVLSEELTNN